MDNRLLAQFIKQLQGELLAVDDVIANLERFHRLMSGGAGRGRPRKFGSRTVNNILRNLAKSDQLASRKKNTATKR